MIINAGCGMSPTKGALNIDNSYSVRLARDPVRLWLHKALRLLSPEQVANAAFARENGVVHMDCTRMKLPDDCADVVYASHMLEHLTRAEARAFLSEARRVLKPSGVLRLVLPDMRLLVDEYVANRDCDRLIERTLLADESGKSLIDRLHLLLFGHRGHRWMYDVPSTLALLTDNGFTDVRSLNAGETMIPDKSNIDLFERADESLYVEARPVKGA